MSNIEEYNRIFIRDFDVDEEQLDGLEYQGVDKWDSIGHMTMITDLEDAFDIMFDTDDIIDFNSYKKGIELLVSHYGIEF